MATSASLDNVAKDFDWDDDSDFDFDEDDESQSGVKVNKSRDVGSDQAYDGFGFSSDEDDFGVDTSGNNADFEVCAQCFNLTDQGDFDIDDGKWYCIVCWKAFDSSLGSQKEHIRQDDTKPVSAREFPNPTSGERNFIRRFHADIAQKLILSLYTTKEEYELDEQLGLEEDLKTAELLAAKEIKEASQSPRRRATMSKSPRQTEEGEKYQSLTDSVLQAGWLEKRGGGTSRMGNTRYKRRWFELVRTTTGIYLTYQTEPRDGSLKGAIDMSTLWLQNDPSKLFSLHGVSSGSSKRVFHLKAPTLPEKNVWLRILNSQLSRPETLSKVIKTKSVPDLAGWLSLRSIQSSSKKDTPKDRWCELWKDQKKLEVFESAVHSNVLLSIALDSAAVVNDLSIDVNSFSIMVGPVEYRFENNLSTKGPWLDALVPLTSVKMLMEKNSARTALSPEVQSSLSERRASTSSRATFVAAPE